MSSVSDGAELQQGRTGQCSAGALGTWAEVRIDDQKEPWNAPVLATRDVTSVLSSGRLVLYGIRTPPGDGGEGSSVAEAEPD